jgi:hypothetical protein
MRDHSHNCELAEEIHANAAPDAFIPIQTGPWYPVDGSFPVDLSPVVAVNPGETN